MVCYFFYKNNACIIIMYVYVLLCTTNDIHITLSIEYKLIDRNGHTLYLFVYLFIYSSIYVCLIACLPTYLLNYLFIFDGVKTG